MRQQWLCSMISTFACTTRQGGQYWCAVQLRAHTVSRVSASRGACSLARIADTAATCVMDSAQKDVRDNLCNPVTQQTSLSIAAAQ